MRLSWHVPEELEPYISRTESIVRSFLFGLHFIVADTGRDPEYMTEHIGTGSLWNMSAVILGTQMDSGDIKWRAKTSNLKGSGPEDNVLVIQFYGDPSGLPGFKGTALYIAELREACGLLQQDWIPNEGLFQCSVKAGVPISVTVAFDQ